MQTVLVISRSTISGNDADNGGGIAAYYGTSSITETAISGNMAMVGGGIWHGRGGLVLSESTVSGNTAGSGAGIYSKTNLTTQFTSVINSTISGNTASNKGGGIFNGAGQTQIRYSTITNNHSAYSAGSGVASRSSSTLTVVGSSIIAGNSPGGDVQFVEGVTSSFNSQGYNLVGTGNATGSFVSTGDQVGVAPLLGSLADNGGRTKTHALLAGSPAIDKGNPAPWLAWEMYRPTISGVRRSRVCSTATACRARESTSAPLNGSQFRRPCSATTTTTASSTRRILRFGEILWERRG